MNTTILGCTFETWSPGIGDPTVWGWLTVVIYAVATLVTAQVARVGPFPRYTRLKERVFWTCLALGLAALTVNKQLAQGGRTIRQTNMVMTTLCTAAGDSGSTFQRAMFSSASCQPLIPLSP